VTDIDLLQKDDSVYTIEDALARISHPQPVELGPSGLSEASQQVLVEALPPVLVLHLKRFLYGVAADAINKINKHVQFAPELEIPLGTIFSLVSLVLLWSRLRILCGLVGPEIMAPVSGKSAEPVHYKLYGVLYHHGESADSGHYTVDVLHPDGDDDGEGAWLHIDDEAVSGVRYKDIFGGHDNGRMDNRGAYMLFYCRTPLTQIPWPI
jgi:ubiquitin carboxyl-terminal hydrolase 10